MVISRRNYAGTAKKKCTKKRDARAELLFCSLNLLLFGVPVAVAVVGLFGLGTLNNDDDGTMNKKAQIKKAIGLDKRVWINLGLWKTINDLPLP